MSKTRMIVLVVLAGVLMVGAVVRLGAQVGQNKVDVAIRQVPEQVVLYTIHRGSYDQAAMAMGQLFGIAGQNGIKPQGPASFAYLNNPQLVSSEHWLTEIRIPVDKKALRLAGKLGAMTDVKTLPMMEVAVAVKPVGVADPAPIYAQLYSWIFKNGYQAMDRCYETFLANVQTGDYGQMQCEIVAPVQKIQQAGTK